MVYFCHLALFHRRMLKALLYIYMYVLTITECVAVQFISISATTLVTPFSVVTVMMTWVECAFIDV